MSDRKGGSSRSCYVMFTFRVLEYVWRRGGRGLKLLSGYVTPILGSESRTEGFREEIDPRRRRTWQIWPEKITFRDGRTWGGWIQGDRRCKTHLLWMNENEFWICVNSERESRTLGSDPVHEWVHEKPFRPTGTQTVLMSLHRVFGWNLTPAASPTTRT